MKFINAIPLLVKKWYNICIVKDIFIYLDHAAATPIDPRVLDEMKPYFSTKFFNPSSPYAPAVILRREYEEIKHRIAMAIGGKGTDIIMTAGATESINIIMNSVSGHIVTTEIEHPAVLQAVAKHDHTLVSPDKNGMINPADIAKAIRHDTE